MSRRLGGQKGPSKEELIEKLQNQLDELKTESETKYAEISELRTTVETLNEKIDSVSDKLVIEQTNRFEEMKKHLDQIGANVQQKLQENNVFFLEKIKDGQKVIEASKSGQEGEINIIKDGLEADMSASKEYIETELSSLKADFEFLTNRVEEVSEKLHEFEQNKRNNLIFYGIPSEPRETPGLLMQKVSSMIRTNLTLRREIGISKVTRQFTGPEVSGYRPVVVTFDDFKDREEVLRKAAMLKGSNINVSEDLSRKVRKCQAELRRFMRGVKRNNPAAICFLQYDKLYIDRKVYVFSDVQGRVVEYDQDLIDFPDRPGSVLFDDRCSSSMSNMSMMSNMYSGPLSPMKSWRPNSFSAGLNRTQSLYLDDDSISSDERDKKIMDLEETLRKQREGSEDRIKALEIEMSKRNGAVKEMVDTNKVEELEDVIKRLQEKLAACEE